MILAATLVLFFQSSRNLKKMLVEGLILETEINNVLQASLFLFPLSLSVFSGSQQFMSERLEQI